LQAKWLRRVCIVLVLLVAGERLWTLVHAPPTYFDDAYMFLRYAHNLLDGYGLRWNRGEPPVYGATSLPHVLVVALVRSAGLAFTEAGVLQISSGVAAVLLVAALVLTCARFAQHPSLRRQGWFWGALLVSLLAYTEPFQFHAQSGMDTMLAALANTILIYAALALAETPTIRRGIATGLAAYLAYLVRPDNALYALFVPPLCLTLGQPLAASRRPLLAFAAVLSVLIGLDLVVKAAYLGTPVPLGVWVKRPHYYGGFAGEYTWNPLWFLSVFVLGLWVFIGALIVFTTRRSARAVLALLSLVAVTFAAFFDVNQIMGHLGRFYFPSLPFVVVAAALSVDRFFLPPLHVTAPALVARLGGAAIFLLGGAWALDAAGARYQARAASQSLASLGGFHVAAKHPLPDLDSWTSSEEIGRFAHNEPMGTRFAMSEHGLVGAMAPDAVIIDVLGLHDRDFALHGFRAAELWRRAPDVIWMPHPDHTQMIRDILDSSRFWVDYDFYPDAFTYGVALRHYGPGAYELATRFRALWKKRYPGFGLDDYLARPGDPR
jgi:hypothetical protein